MEKKALVLTTTFPRWSNDTTPRFVYDLSTRLGDKYKLIVLAPHYKNALKKENMDNLSVRRFAYFKPESLQKLCYDGGIIPNMQKSFLAKMQMPLLIISELFSAYRIIRKEKISLIHAHWILPQGFVASLLKKFFKIKLLITIHGSDIFALNSFLFRKIQYSVAKNSDFITVNSIATMNEISRRFPEYKNKIKVIPMGVDTSLFRKTAIKKPKKYENSKIILFVGRLSDQKGIQYLIGAMPEIIKIYPEIKLLIIGEGSYGKQLKKQANNKNLEDYIEFLGSMKSKDIADYYNFCDVFVLPSLSTKTGTEALGLSLLEAMSSGCAVIGTNAGGIKYIIKNNKNGLLVEERNSRELSNAVNYILKNKNKSSIFGKNAAKFVRKNYSWEKVSSDFLKIYGELLK